MIRSRLSVADTLPIHPLLRHPRTGAPLRAVGRTKTGRPIWPILGGDGTGGGGDGGTGDGGAGGAGGDGDAGGGKSGGKPDDPSGKDDGGDDDTTDWKAEAEKWKALSRKHEDKAKKNATAATELEQVKRSQMSEQEKAVAQARDEARAEVLRDVGGKLVEAAFVAAAAGRMSETQRDTVLEGLDRVRFLTDDGEVDTDKVKAYVDGIAPAQNDEQRQDDKSGSRRFPDMGQGRRGTGDKPSVARGRELYESRRKTKQTA